MGITNVPTISKKISKMNRYKRKTLAATYRKRVNKKIIEEINNFFKD